MKLPTLVLSELLHSDTFFKTVIPHLKEEYFQEKPHKALFQEIKKFSDRYMKNPSAEVLEVELDKRKDLDEGSFERAADLIREIKGKAGNVDYTWLVNETEQFCRNAALYNAMNEGIGIMQGEVKGKQNEAIPSLIMDALAISFDSRVGHDYFADADWAFAKYHEKAIKIPFKQDWLNRITKGGVSAKTLNVLAAGTGGFKSGTMCDFAAHWVMQGYKVLYVTLEMAEERIRERIDANIMKIATENVLSLSRTAFLDRVTDLRTQTTGDLIIKEYPPASVHAGHFRSLIQEIQIKKGYKPDIVFIDYLNIATSMRFKNPDSLYVSNKAIAEELRGLAVEQNIPIWTATQFNRSGNDNTDPSLANVSESHGISATCDLMLALIITEELEEKGMMLWKQLKNRYNQKGKSRRMMLGVDFDRMTVYDLPDDSEARRYLSKKSTKEAEETAAVQLVEQKKGGRTNDISGFKFT